MSAEDPRPTARRRTGGRRLDVTVLLAAVLPVLTVAALLGIRPEAEPAAERPPQRTELTRATLVCPAVEAPLTVGTTTSEQGRLDVRVGDTARQVRVRPDRLSQVGQGTGPAVVTGRDDLAPGLLAGRFPTDGAATAAECTPPGPDLWFTGAGAGARHSSVVELVNPDRGRAVVDVEVVAPGGRPEVPRLRGVTVPGRATVRLPLADVVPRQGDLALHVTTSRGRVGVAVLDRYDALGGGPSGEDWLPAQAEPSTESLLLGLPTGEGRRTLVLANPGEDEVRATVRVVTDESVFTPEGSEEVVVRAGTVTQVALSAVVPDAARDGALGLRVEASGPVTATLRSFVGGDLAHTTVDPVLQPGTTATVLPRGARRLLLAGAERSGSVQVVARAAGGERLGGQRADLGADRGTAVPLPEGTRLLQVRLRGTPVSAAVLAEGDGVQGAAVARLRPLVTSGLVGDVEPARR